MSFSLKDNSQSFSNKGKRFSVPKGTYPAILVRMYDFGTTEVEYKGTKKNRHTVQFIFELPTVKHKFAEDKDEQPAWLYSKFTLSMFHSDKTQTSSKLYDFIVAAIGKNLNEQEAKDFDLGSLLGKTFMITVDHREWEGNTYENIVTAILVTQENFSLYNVPWDTIKPENEVFGFAIEGPQSFESEEFKKIPAHTQKKILESKEGQEYLTK